MKVIGLAGRPGSGKSAAARELARRTGVAFIDLDRVAWEIYRLRTQTYWRLVWRFGKEILGPDGKIDRARLAERAFATAKAREDLNAIVHPAVIARLKEILVEEERRGTEVLLVEGALLASSSHVNRALFTAILWLEANEKTRRRRLEGIGRGEHVSRVAEEPPSGEAIRIDADKSLGETVERIALVIDSLKDSASGPCSLSSHEAS